MWETAASAVLLALALALALRRFALAWVEEGAQPPKMNAQVSALERDQSRLNFAQSGV
jgi:hypothetical protein